MEIDRTCDVVALLPLLHDPLLGQELAAELVHLRGEKETSQHNGCAVAIGSCGWTMTSKAAARPVIQPLIQRRWQAQLGLCRRVEMLV